MPSVQLPVGLRFDSVKVVKSLDLTKFHTCTEEEKLSIMSGWSLLAILGYSTYSASSAELVCAFFERRMHAVLAYFVADPARLLTVVTRTKSVFYGSVVVKIFDLNSNWAPSNLDICCPIDVFDEVCRFVVDELGGQVTRHDRPGQIVNSMDSKFGGVCEHKSIRTATATFNVMRSLTNAAVYPIPFAYSDMLINAMSGNGISVGYPWQVVGKAGRCCSFELGEEYAIRRAATTWRNRGFHLSHRSEGTVHRHGDCPQELRYFGDFRSLNIRFGLDTDPPKVSYDMHMSLAWVVGWLFSADVCEQKDCATNLLPSSCTIRALDWIHPC